MGKKKAKQAAQAGDKPAPLVQADWKKIDANPIRLLTGKDVKDFTEWENKPALFKADDIRKRLFTGLCDMPSVEKLLKTAAAEDLRYGIDLKAVKCEDAQRVPEPEPLSLNVEEVPALYHEEGYTLQFLQPQRFDDSLWRLLAALEAQLGCLVGCNAYLTPKDTQGLAPHHDDVELWVCQTQGSKRWRLYAPKDGYSLPATSSRDFTQEEIGEPVMDITLEVGDVLYLPRGTIHQAVASLGQPSSHLTISTYQQWTYGALAAGVLQQGTPEREPATRLPLEMRRGLPFRLLQDTALEASVAAGPSAPPAAQGAAKTLAAALRALAEQVESKPEVVGPSLLPMAEEFMRYRLPPHPDQLRPTGEAPSMDSTLYPTGRQWCMLKQSAHKDEDGKQYVKLCTCLGNDRTAHMMHMADDSDEEDEDEEVDLSEWPFAGGEGDEDEEEEEEAPELVEAAEAAIEKLKAAGKKAGQEEGQELNGGKAGKGKGKRKREAGEEEEEGEGKAAKKAANGSSREAAAAAPNGTEKGSAKKGKKGEAQSEKGEEAEEEEKESDAPKGKGKKAAAKAEQEEAKAEEEEEEEDVGASEGEEVEDEDEDEDEDEVEDDDGLSGLLFEAVNLEALSRVLCASGSKGIAVKDLPLPDNASKSQFSMALWGEGVASTKPVV